MNKYYSSEGLRFIVKSEGKDSSDAYEKHCEVISAIIDAARRVGAEIDENFDSDNGTRIYFVDADGEGLEVQGWMDGSKDEYPENKS